MPPGLTQTLGLAIAHLVLGGLLSGCAYAAGLRRQR